MKQTECYRHVWVDYLSVWLWAWRRRSISSKTKEFSFLHRNQAGSEKYYSPFKEVLRALFLTVNRSKVNISYCLHLTKVKQFHYRPGQAQSVPGCWGSQISRQLAHEGGKVVGPTHRPPLPQELISVRGWASPRAIVRPEGLCQWKIPMTLLGIEAATFQLVTQCLNKLRHRVPHLHLAPNINP